MIRQTVGIGPDGTACTPVVAARMGADLRAARERLGYTLPAISAHLRIRLPYLKAIEDGRIADLPGNAYAMGFVRTYAAALGLDSDEISRRFRAEAAEVNRKTELSFPVPVPERGVPAGAMMLLGLVLVVGAYVGWYHWSGENATPTPVRPVPARLAAVAPPPATPPTASAPVASAPAADSPAMSSPTAAHAATTHPAAPAPSPAVPSPAAPGPATSSTAVPPAPRVLAGLPVIEPPPPVLMPATPPPTAEPTGAAPATPPAGPTTAGPLTASAITAQSTLALHATEDAWVQVRDRRGSVLLNRILHPGETWPVPPGHPGLTFTTGNAGGTQILVDGKPTPVLGASGAVRRDLPLDAAALRSGKLVALSQR